MEVMRLRNVLLRLVAETKELERIYHSQRKLIGRESYKMRFNDQAMSEGGSMMGDKMNFVDEGPMTGVETYLAVTEFDKTLLS
jgi:hypothetical protein